MWLLSKLTDRRETVRPSDTVGFGDLVAKDTVAEAEGAEADAEELQ